MEQKETWWVGGTPMRPPKKGRRCRQIAGPNSTIFHYGMTTKYVLLLVRSKKTR